VLFFALHLFSDNNLELGQTRSAAAPFIPTPG